MNMRKIAIVMLISGLIAGFTSCKETDSVVNDQNNEWMRDTLKKTYPSLYAAQIRIHVKEFQDIDILLGDKQLFNKTEEEQQQIVNEIAKIAYSIYIENNYLDEGKITFTQNETAAQQRAAKPDDPKKEYEFNFKDYAPKE